MVAGQVSVDAGARPALAAPPAATSAGRQSLAVAALAATAFSLSALALAGWLRFWFPAAMGYAVEARAALFGLEPTAKGLDDIGAPLLVLLQLPLLAIPPLRNEGYAAVVVSAGAGVATALVLHRAFALTTLSSGYRALLLLAFIASPPTLLYAASGLPATLEAALLTLAFASLLDWAKTERTEAIVVMGLASGLAVLADYRAWIAGVALFAALWLLLAKSPRQAPGRTMAGLLAYALPAIAIVGGWAWFTSLAASDATPFGAAPFGASTLAHRPAAGMGAAARALTSAGLFAPALVPALALALTARLRRASWTCVALAIPAAVLPAALAFDALRTAGAGTLAAAFPLAPLMLVFVAAVASEAPARLRAALMALALLAPIVGTLALLHAGDAGPWEASVARAVRDGERMTVWDETRQAARYIDERAGRGRVLTDDATTFPVLFFARADRFLTPRDDTFGLALERPWLATSFALLGPDDGDRLAAAHAGLRDADTGWSEAERDWPRTGWSLVRIDQRAPPAGSADEGANP